MNELLAIKGRLGNMEKIAEAESDFGDFRAVMFKTADGRHFVKIEPFNRSEKARVEWLPGDEYLEWLRCWSKYHAV